MNTSRPVFLRCVEEGQDLICSVYSAAMSIVVWLFIITPLDLTTRVRVRPAMG